MVIRSLLCIALAATPGSPTALDAEALDWISSQAPVVDGDNEKIAGDMAGASAKTLLQDLASDTDPNQSSHRITRIFVSRSMPRDDLIAALSSAQRDRNTVVVFRGLPEGAGLAGFQRELIGWLGPFAHWSSPPQIQLDPPAFRQASVEVVPTVALYDGLTLLAVVPGLVDGEWLRRQVDAGRRGHLPAQGPTVDISEKDLLELMQTRFAAFDWQNWRREQGEGLMRSMRPPNLSHAERSQTRFHEPGFEVTAHIEFNGQRIASAGDRINPLHHIPFSQQLLVVDATDTRQVEVARQWIADWTGPTTLLTTVLPDSDIAGFLDRQSKRLGLPIQMYRAELGTAFGIKHVPSRVRAEAGRFRIDEVAPSGAQEVSDDDE